MSFFEQLLAKLGVAREGTGLGASRARDSLSEIGPAGPLGYATPTLPPPDDTPPNGVLAAVPWTAEDDARLEEEVQSLFNAGDFERALSLLSEHSRVISAHAPASVLPCLCPQCLRPEVASAEWGGLSYERDVVIVGRRALLFWTPCLIHRDASAVQLSLRTTLRTRLIRQVSAHRLARRATR